MTYKIFESIYFFDYYYWKQKRSLTNKNSEDPITKIYYLRKSRLICWLIPTGFLLQQRGERQRNKLLYCEDECPIGVMPIKNKNRPFCLYYSISLQAIIPKGWTNLEWVKWIFYVKTVQSHSVRRRHTKC